MLKISQIILILTFCVLILTSCSTFRGSRQLNMEPFSDNASILFGEAAKISRPFKWKHLKAYLDIPEFKQLQGKAQPILIALNGIVYYSQQVVVINNSRLPEKDHSTRYHNLW